MTSFALLIIRATVGGLLAGHGAQKLFGFFGGHGVDGTAGWLESLNLRPGKQWAVMAGLSEFLGGTLTALGALNPLGPIMAMGAMAMATLKVHVGKPIWVSAGGAELPVTNIAVLTGLFLAGPGKFSFDSLLGLRIPRWFSVAALVGMVATTWMVATQSGLADEAATGGDEVEAGGELQAEGSSRLAADDAGSKARPDVESWGSPDAGEPSDAETSIAAISRSDV